MLWAVVAAFALALDLSSVKSEPKLEKRSELALQYAASALDLSTLSSPHARKHRYRAASSSRRTTMPM